MTRLPLENIEPRDIFMHALGFHVAEDALGKLTRNPNVQLASHVVQPTMVMSALTTELFLKCLVCIETRLTPPGHHLFALFEQTEPATQAEITHLWDTHIVPVRDPEWKLMENSISGDKKFARDLPGALQAASRAFEQIRYSYEPESKNSTFHIGDMPRILHRVILTRKPEWANLGHSVMEIGKVPDRQK